MASFEIAGIIKDSQMLSPALENKKDEANIAHYVNVTGKIPNTTETSNVENRLCCSRCIRLLQVFNLQGHQRACALRVKNTTALQLPEELWDSSIPLSVMSARQSHFIGH